MKIAKTVLAVISLMALSSCGKHHLTDAQKAELQETLTSSGRVPTAVQGAAPAPAGSPDPSGSPQPVAGRMLNLGTFARIAADVGSNGSSDDSAEKMSSLLKEKSQSKACVIQTNLPEPDSTGRIQTSPGGGDFKIQVTGDTCPIAMSLDMTVQATDHSAGMKVAMDYSVKDDTFRSYNDVDALSMNGSFDVSGDEHGMQGTLDVKGSLHSQKYGQVQITFAGNVSASENSKSGELSETFDFPDFSAELKISYDGDQTKYSINGEDMTEQQFEDFLNKGGVVFGTGHPKLN